MRFEPTMEAIERVCMHAGGRTTYLPLISSHMNISSLLRVIVVRPS